MDTHQYYVTHYICINIYLKYQHVEDLEEDYNTEEEEKEGEKRVKSYMSEVKAFLLFIISIMNLYTL